MKKEIKCVINEEINENTKELGKSEKSKGCCVAKHSQF
jgi:hypothetical protein